MDQPHGQNVPGKIDEASPAGHIHGKAAQRSTKDLMEWLHLRPDLVLSWCEASGTIDDC